jgi:F-type H+-transporting ATPase subunit b
MTITLLAAGGWVQMLIVQVMGFAILALILVKLVVPVLKKILFSRTKTVEETFSRLEAETAAASRDLAEIQRRLSEVEAESQRRHAAAKADAEATSARAREDADKQSAAILEKGRKEIEIEREKALLELRQETERLTLAAADHLTKTAVTDEIHRRLVDRYLDQIEGSTRP